MLPDTDYKLALSTLTKAETRIAEIADFVACHASGDICVKETAARAQRLQRHHDRLQSAFATLHGFSGMVKDVTFKGVLDHTITNNDKKIEAEDRGFFAEIHADMMFRHNFFRAMDELVAANDNPFSAGPIAKIKKFLMGREFLNNSTIAQAVLATGLSGHNVNAEAYTRALIGIYNDMQFPHRAHQRRMEAATFKVA